MSHTNHTTSLDNKDLSNGRTKSSYLKLAHGWTDPCPPIAVETVRHEINGRAYKVVREDLLAGGTKRRFGGLLFSRIKEKHVVYVAPRHGHAGIALAHLCKEHNKTLTLFMPACQTISPNQAKAIELGARPVFYRIAAMPNLNAVAQQFARDHGNAFFIPLGLRHELVTAAAVTVADGLFRRFKRDRPTSIWTAISTGVLSRALQIAAGDSTKFVAVAVSRNIHDGEKGSADILSHHRAFVQDAESQPPFPSASNYDAKCWEYMGRHDAPDGTLFWNVANNEIPTVDRFYRIEADVPWGTMRVFDFGLRKYTDRHLLANTETQHKSILIP